MPKQTNNVHNIKKSVIMLLGCMLYIQASEHVQMPTINVVMCCVRMSQEQVYENMTWWKVLKVKEKHKICGIPYNEGETLMKVRIAHKVSDELYADSLIHNPPLLRQAMIAAYAKKGLDKNNSDLLQELMRPQLPEWISLDAVKHLNVGDTFDFFLHECCIKARIVSTKTYESLITT